jgi:hypothetical protein
MPKTGETIKTCAAITPALLTIGQFLNDFNGCYSIDRTILDCAVSGVCDEW